MSSTTSITWSIPRNLPAQNYVILCIVMLRVTLNCVFLSLAMPNAHPPPSPAANHPVSQAHNCYATIQFSNRAKLCKAHTKTCPGCVVASMGSSRSSDDDDTSTIGSTPIEPVASHGQAERKFCKHYHRNPTHSITVINKPIMFKQWTYARTCTQNCVHMHVSTLTLA